MAGVSKAIKLDSNVQPGLGKPDGAPPLSRKVHALVTKAGYAAPKVISFPIDGMRVSQVSLAGNT
jgi:hypothetical protein